MSNTSDIASLKAWRTAHTNEHKAGTIHKHEVTPPPVEPPPPPLVVTDWQAAINAASPGATLNFTGTGYAKAITISKPLTIIGGDLDGKNSVGTGVSITGADVTLRGMKIHDCTYAGVMVLSGTRVKVQQNVIERIGKVAYDADVAAGGGPVRNAYGIALSQTSGAVCLDCEVTGNTVDWVPSWEGIDAHGGRNLTFADNIVKHTNRAYRIQDPGGKRPQNVRLDRNTASLPTKRQDVLNIPPYNEVAFSLYDTDGLSGSGNIAEGWPEALDTRGSTPAWNGVIVR